MLTFNAYNVDWNVLKGILFKAVIIFTFYSCKNLFYFEKCLKSYPYLAKITSNMKNYRDQGTCLEKSIQVWDSLINCPLPSVIPNYHRTWTSPKM